MVVKGCLDLIVGLLRTSPGIVLGYSQVGARVLGRGWGGAGGVLW